MTAPRPTASSTPNETTTPGVPPSAFSASPQATVAIDSKSLAEAEIAKSLGAKWTSLSPLWFMENILGIKCLYTREPAIRAWINEYGRILRHWLAHRWDLDEDGNLCQKVPIKVLKVLPRKWFKTSTNEALAAWLLTQDPNLVMGVMSASYEDLAVAIAKNVRSHLEGDAADNWITTVFGNFKSSDSWSGDKFTIAQRDDGRRDPNYQAYGVRKGAVGHHFDYFEYDDPVTNEAMANNSDWLQRVVKAWIDGKATINPNGFVGITMTRYHDNDLAGYVIKSEIEPAVKAAHGGELPADWSPEDPEALQRYAHHAGWHVIYRQAVLEPDTPDAVYTSPNIWGRERVSEVRSGNVHDDADDAAHEYSELFFWCQLQNQPQKRADNPINEVHIATAMGNPDRWSIAEAPRTGWVDIYCDLALKDQDAYIAQRGDYTVAHVCVQRDGFVWRINGYRGKPTQDIFADELVKLATWAKNEFGARIRYLTYDKLTGHGSGDRSTEMWLANVFRRYPSLNMPIVKPLPRAGTKKEAKILGTAWAWQEGWVRLCGEAPFTDPLVYQMQRIGYTRPDDDADAFADAFHPDIYQVAANLTDDTDDDWDWTPAMTVATDSWLEEDDDGYGY